MLESHGGTVEKFIGDAVMGVLASGRPTTTTRFRAVRAAYRVGRTALAELNDELRRDYDVRALRPHRYQHG